MVADFRRRFWVCLALTVPVLALSPMIQSFLGIREALLFPGSDYVLFALSAIIFFYGGWPFLKGLFGELTSRRPGMMTLIALAITVAFVYSGAVVFGLSGKVFFWELATLIDVMLLGHWIEMRSVMGASGALEALVRLLPATAHRVTDGGETEEVPVTELTPGDTVLVKPGEKVPIDGVIVKGRSNFNESMLTGESRPVAKGEGEEAVGGAGVMFSIDTETGFDKVVVVDAAWGLGENVVQGAVDPDEYQVFKPLLEEGDLSPIIEKKLGE